VVMFENEYILLMNTPCSHLHSRSVTGVNSGLANGVVLTCIMGEVRRACYVGMDQLLISFLYCSMFVFWVVF
jgi:hypothetical protein